MMCILGCSEGIEDTVVVRVDDRILTLAEFNEYFDRIKTSSGMGETANVETIQEARLRVLLQLVEEMIIMRRGEELDLDISSTELEAAVRDFQNDYSEEGFQDMLLRQAVSFEAWKERFRRRLLVEKVMEEDLLKDVSVSPEEIKTYFHKHRDEWARGEALKVRHIMTQNKDEADRVLEQLKKGEDFAGLARLHSTAPEGRSGGDMGWVFRGELPKYLEDPIFKTEPGTLSAVVKSPFGFHVFQVTEKKKGGKGRIDDCVEEIRNRIEEEKLAAAYGPWLAKFRERYDIEINKELIL